jgi:hypothetical protein
VKYRGGNEPRQLQEALLQTLKRGTQLSGWNKA